LFRGYVEQHLAPTLGAGDVVIMDNLNSHKVAGVQVAIERLGAEVWYLPPYSPDLNPIEQVFSKFKWLIRSAEEQTIGSLWRCCGNCWIASLKPSTATTSVTVDAATFT
jgi:transposase